jgi:hypothetical protein
MIARHVKLWQEDPVCLVAISLLTARSPWHHYPQSHYDATNGIHTIVRAGKISNL